MDFYFDDIPVGPPEIDIPYCSNKVVEPVVKVKQVPKFFCSGTPEVTEDDFCEDDF